jgi:amino acid transporter
MNDDTASRTEQSPSPTATATERLPVWKHGVVAAVAAAVATTVIAAIASAAGVAFSDGKPETESIPTVTFAVFTLIFSLIGVGLAAILARKARKPRSTFVRTAIGLLVLSFVPDLTFGFTAGSAATLIALHIVAAAIVVPVLASRLAPTR